MHAELTVRKQHYKFHKWDDDSDQNVTLLKTLIAYIKTFKNTRIKMKKPPKYKDQKWILFLISINQPTKNVVVNLMWSLNASYW